MKIPFIGMNMNQIFSVQPNSSNRSTQFVADLYIHIYIRVHTATATTTQIYFS